MAEQELFPIALAIGSHRNINCTKVAWILGPVSVFQAAGVVSLQYKLAHVGK